MHDPRVHFVEQNNVSSSWLLKPLSAENRIHPASGLTNAILARHHVARKQNQSGLNDRIQPCFQVNLARRDSVTKSRPLHTRHYPQLDSMLLVYGWGAVREVSLILVERLRIRGLIRFPVGAKCRAVRIGPETDAFLLLWFDLWINVLRMWRHGTYRIR